MGKSIRDILGIDSIIDNISGYLENKLELLKIELKEDAADLASKVVVILFSAFLLFAFVMFISLAVAIVLNQVFESSYIGYLAVAATYLFLFLVLVMLKDKLQIETKVKRYLSKLINR